MTDNEKALLGALVLANVLGAALFWGAVAVMTWLSPAAKPLSITQTNRDRGC